MARTNVSRETFAWYGSSRGTGRGDVAAGAMRLRGRARCSCEGERDRAGALRVLREWFAMILRGFRESPRGFGETLSGLCRGLGGDCVGILLRFRRYFAGIAPVVVYECFT